MNDSRVTTTKPSTPDLRKEPTTLSGLLKHPAYSSRFEELLKDKAAQFTSSILQVGRSLGDDCDPKSIIGSAMIAAAVDLPINPSLGFAWIVPYKVRGKKMAQFQMGYKGYVQLALRTGQYSRLNVCPVYDGELVGANKLTGDIILDESKRKSDKIIGYASYMKLVSGFEHAEYWSVETVKDHASRYSQSFRSGYESPWKSNFDQMAMKTVLSSHIRHWGPMSVSVQRAVEADGAVISEPGATPDYVDNGKQQPEQRVPELGRNEPEAEPDMAPDDNGGIDASRPDQEPDQKESAAEPTMEAKAEPVVERITHQVEHPAKLVDIREPGPVAPESPQAMLLEILSSNGVKLELFANYIMVNGVDRKHGFNSELSGHVTRWPDSGCEAILKDTALMGRIIQKFKKT